MEVTQPGHLNRNVWGMGFVFGWCAQAGPDGWTLAACYIFALQFGMLELNRLRVSSRSQFGALPALQVAQAQDPWQCVSAEAESGSFEFGNF